MSGKGEAYSAFTAGGTWEGVASLVRSADAHHPMVREKNLSSDAVCLSVCLSAYLSVCLSVGAFTVHVFINLTHCPGTCACPSSLQ